MSSRRHVLGRRSLLRLGTAAFAAPVVAHATDRESIAGETRSGPAQPAAPAGTRLFAARLVPDGADCSLAFASDQHWWPGHKENWGNGAQITSISDAKMPDLAARLNDERPHLSIHAGDVISAAGSFFPTPEEYGRQLAFAKQFYGMLTHPAIPTVGNHETLDAHYAGHDQLAAWRQHFGEPYREHDVSSWRFLTLNPMLPNPDRRLGRGDGYGNYYGLDEPQLAWLRARLADARTRERQAVVAVHVPPSNWLNAGAFEEIIAGAGCVKAVLCGHWHRNHLSLLGGVPVIVRASNVETPFGYSMIHGYPDGRLIVVQQSQHFPYEEFLSAGFASGKQGSVAERYLTLGGSSHRPLDGLRLVGAGARAAIGDGVLRVSAGEGRAALLIEAPALGDARLSLTAVKLGAARMGGLARADANGRGGVEAVVTSRYSPDGKVMLIAGGDGRRDVLARSWFNIADDIAYRLVLEVRAGRVRAAFTRMLDLEAPLPAVGGGHYGFFVEEGGLVVTDLTLDRL